VSESILTAQLFGASLGARTDAPKNHAPKMPKVIAALTDIQIRNAKQRDKAY
jgi:hypothetical protein